MGGQRVEVNEYPWMVGLKRSGSSHPSCGAALLNSNWLVTVHVYTSSQSKTSFVLGDGRPLHHRHLGAGHRPPGGARRDHAH